MDEIGIVGAGSYGTALAQCFCNSVEKIVMISDLAEVSNSINKQHVNSRFCPYVVLDQKIVCSLNIDDLKNSKLIFLAVPSEAIEEVCMNLKKNKIGAPLILCSKGVDIVNGRLLGELIHDICPDNKFVIFSGPSFASEIAKGMKAGVNVASNDYALAQKIAKIFSSENFKVEAIDDPIGLQIGGAFKNMLAVGCGLYRGLGHGESTIARLIVEGIKEMAELAEHLGGKKETFLEYGGIGDTILTCTSTQSRNVLFGKYIASGGTVKNWQGPLAEGARSIKAIPIFETKYGVNLKIFREIHDRIYPNVKNSGAKSWDNDELA